MKNTHIKKEESPGSGQTFPLADQRVGEGKDMVSAHMFYRIRQLTDEGLNQIEIGKALRLNRKTVAKYQDTNTPPKYKERVKVTRHDPFASFESRAESLIEDNPSNSAREIYEILVEEGYKGSERTVSRRVQLIRGRKPKERFFEQSYEPGEQSQFDFKERLILPFIDGEREVNLLFGTLPYSDVCQLKAFPFKTYECFIEGVHSFFEKIGGVPENIRIDNLSPCVTKVLKGNQRLYTKSFQRAIDHYGFNVLPCAPGKGSDKGDVEREIRTVASRIKNLVKNKSLVFKDWEDLNAFLDSYVQNRESDSTKEKFAEESKHLKKIASRDEDVLCKVEIGTCSSYGTVRINKTAYSVPDAAIGTGCKTVMGAYDVRIYSVSDRKHEWASQPEDA